mmetsp:Transcript_73802/g.196423  ORF Transcript_73802/g.196423 Transcript_73802/m.196423 type:complete len:357 (+) Transcript_73802:2104-3174(+)
MPPSATRPLHRSTTRASESSGPRQSSASWSSVKLSMATPSTLKHLSPGATRPDASAAPPSLIRFTTRPPRPSAARNVMPRPYCLPRPLPPAPPPLPAFSEECSPASIAMEAGSKDTSLAAVPLSLKSDEVEDSLSTATTAVIAMAGRRSMRRVTGPDGNDGCPGRGERRKRHVAMEPTGPRIRVASARASRSSTAAPSTPRSLSPGRTPAASAAPPAATRFTTRPPFPPPSAADPLGQNTIPSPPSFPRPELAPTAEGTTDGSPSAGIGAATPSSRTSVRETSPPPEVGRTTTIAREPAGPKTRRRRSLAGRQAGMGCPSMETMPSPGSILPLLSAGPPAFSRLTSAGLMSPGRGW